MPVLRYFREVWERGDVDLLDVLLTDDFIDHDPPPGFPPDRPGHKRLATHMLAMMSQPQYTLHAVVNAGDYVTVRYDVLWRQRGDFFGVPADGHWLTLRGCDLYRLRAGRIAESWHVEAAPSGLNRDRAPATAWPRA